MKHMVTTVILVVEDNFLNLKLAKVTLSLENYDVRTASTAQEALDLLTTIKPHLILMDIQLPGVDGLELSKRLKSDARYKDIIIIATTAYAMKGDKEKALDAGCDD